MAKRTQSNSTDWAELFQEARDSFSVEIAGLAIFLIGIFALFSLRSSDPWLSTMLGWAALPFALTLIVLGTVMMLRRYAGYWSAEALVGIELVLLCGLVMTHLLNNDSVDWTTNVNGYDGGMVGWATGNLLASGLGRWPAFLLMLALAFIGMLLLVRYTPMIYGVHYTARLFPVLPAIWGATADALPRRQAHVEPAADPRYPAYQAASFVSATEADAPMIEMASDVPVKMRRKGAKSGSGKSAGKSTVTAKSTAAKKQTAPKPVRSAENLPPLDLLEPDSGDYSGTDVSELEVLIESTLEDFNVPVKVVHVESGPTVTQFGVEPLYLERGGQRRKVRVNRIVALADDLALALAAPAVRIEAPVPGRPYVGIEVPNIDKTVVGLRDILESREMRKMDGNLILPLGRDTAGKPIIMDLVRAPHMLIAGQTGSGKSVCINTIINGLLMQHGPESLKFVMVDPKMVELPGYNGIPHLLSKVITDMDQVMGALTWMLIEMDDRYQAVPRAWRAQHRCLQCHRQTAQVDGATALYRADRRRTRRFDDDGRRGYRAATLPIGADGPRHRHPPDPGHPATQHRCGHRSDQGQLPHAHRLCRHQPDRQPRDPGSAGGRTTVGSGRHVGHAPGRCQAVARAGLLGGRSPRSNASSPIGRRVSRLPKSRSPHGTASWIAWMRKMN